MENPLFSVIITTYNRKDILPAAIKSVLGQTFKNFELLVIDNGSTDDTADVVRNINDVRIKYIRNPNPSASCDAPRNLGIRMAKGSLIAFLDDDDLWYPQRLEKVKNTFEAQPEADVVCHDIDMVENGKFARLWESVPDKKGLYETLLYERTCFGPIATTLKKSILESMGGFELKKEFDGVADYDLWLRLAAKNVRVYHLKESLAQYSITGNNFTMVNCAVGARFAYIARRHIIEYEKRPIFAISKKGMSRMCQLYLIAGFLYLKSGQFLNAIKYCSKALGFVIIRPSLVAGVLARAKAVKKC